MARRIEIELTSARPDGSWTWRAAGAREPRGVLDGGLLHQGAKPGDVLRAEADFEIEGITIVAVAAPKAPEGPEPNRIEIIGPGRQEAPGVTTQLVGRGDRRTGDRRRDRDESRPRRDRDNGRSPSGRESNRPGRGGPSSETDTTTRRERPGRGEQAERTRRREGGDRRGRRTGDDDTIATEGAEPGADGAHRTGRTGRADRAERRPAAGTRPGRAARQEDEGAEPVRRGGRQPAEGGPASRPAERRPRRFSPGHSHRQAMLASLPPEEQPVAEQVLRGGIPAVRTALHLEREKAVAEGRPAPNTDQLIAMAEALLPRLKAAEWRDRADAAIKAADEISLRDLRSVVAGADVARDDESRELAARLRDALEQRLSTLKTQWEEEVTRHLDERRLVRALRLAGRPPEPAARLEPQLAQRLSDAAGEAMSPETTSDRWMALIDAVASSPVRRTVQPAGLPPDPDPELRRAAQQQSGRIPALAALLGIAIPPPPQPNALRRPARRPGADRPGRSDRPEKSERSGHGRRPKAVEPDQGEAETRDAPGGEPTGATPADTPPADTPPVEAAEAPAADTPPVEAAEAPAADASPAEQAEVIHPEAEQAEPGDAPPIEAATDTEGGEPAGATETDAEPVVDIIEPVDPVPAGAGEEHERLS